jgi:hypothetical protein
MNIANRLSCEPKEVAELMKKQVGDVVKKGETLAVSKGFFGLMKTLVPAPRDGKIESISDKTGQLFIREPAIPVQIDAYLDGVVSEVIEREGVVVRAFGTYIQGIFGIGGETTGELVFVVDSPDQPMQPEKITAEHRGKILIGGSYVTIPCIQAAVKAGAAGIIVGGIDDYDLRAWLGYDLGVAITGQEELGLTLVVTEGFGRIEMAHKTFDLLKKHQGRKASISGATQIRAGVIRPEVFVPATGEKTPVDGPGEERRGMDVGTPVRIIREPNFGHLATVVELPVELQVVESETRVRVVRVRLQDGQEWVLPRANVEVIEA